MFVSEKEITCIYQNLESPNKKLIIYAGANHQSFLQYDPVYWQKNITSLIDSVNP